MSKNKGERTIFFFWGGGEEFWFDFCFMLDQNLFSWGFSLLCLGNSLLHGCFVSTYIIKGTSSPLQPLRILCSRSFGRAYGCYAVLFFLSKILQLSHKAPACSNGHQAQDQQGLPAISF